MDTPLSVKRFLEQLKIHTEPRFAHVCLVGEVSNFRSSERHWYFTLKEEGAALSCAVWMTNQKRLKHIPRDGERVVIKGSLNVYVSGGSFTLAVTQCELAGIGDLRQRLRELEAMLRSDGVFDRPKRELPRLPKKIAVIAALGGAALRDILEVTHNRAPGIDIMVFPAAAQGESCVMENLMALQEAQDEYWGCDVVLMARGGGSPEDLWSYNDPDLARAVSSCRLPIITGVGHEIDLTLVDLASDKRAATPSQAAEFVTPDRSLLWSELVRKTERLNRYMDWRLRGLETTLNLLTDQGLERLDPLDGHRKYLAQLAARLERAVPYRRLDIEDARLDMLRQRLRLTGPNAVRWASSKIKGHIRRLDSVIGHTLEQSARRLEVALANLKGQNPVSPLSKGFALVRDQENNQVKLSVGIKTGAKLRLEWKDGGRSVIVE
ncbi:MAG: exodeoxyribonuclease VII large subunit [Holophagales bacterium]|jgi:exodeoxyribonuclease VII large subunit|nr:exodeoxyribonuclease VII large subunit [Holophagales bacterium]